ncbi:hypothetical protein GX865_00555 [Candidatus Saccharibacteria bacterium]|jgi:hypothetical protein|nr:hypothetical protein [Candidatus Saccharibacteria bacterium]
MKEYVVEFTNGLKLTKVDIIIFGLIAVVCLLILLVLVKIAQLRKIYAEQEKNLELIARRIEFSTFGGNKKIKDEDLK